MPPSGAAVGENRGRLEDRCKSFSILGCGPCGVWGTKLNPLWAARLCALESFVERLSPILLGLLAGGFGGMMKEGEVGAWSGCGVSIAWTLDVASRGGCAAGLWDADVFRERFLVLRFLPGESPRLKPGIFGSGLSGGSMATSRGEFELVLRDSKEPRGIVDVGDSGEELGDGSVSEESNVEMVVVGEESVESDLYVEEEPRRGIRDKKSLFWASRSLWTMVVPFDAFVSVASTLFRPLMSELAPNTDINDGIEASSD